MTPLYSPPTSSSPTPVICTHAQRLARAHVANTLVRESDTGLTYLDDGVNWLIWHAIGVVPKLADETVNNSSALQDDDALFWPVEINERWAFEFHLLLSSPSSASDFKFGLSLPTGVTGVWAASSSSVSVGFSWTASLTSASPNTLALTSASISLGGASGANGFGVILKGMLLADGSHAGNAKLQWAQSVATVEDSKVLAGSLAELRRLA